MGRAARYKPTRDGHKVCAHCRTERPLAEFYPSSITKDGREAWCPLCKQVNNRAYYHAHLDEKRAYGRAYSRAYYHANRERILAKRKKALEP